MKYVNNDREVIVEEFLDPKDGFYKFHDLLGELLDQMNS